MEKGGAIIIKQKKTEHLFNFNQVENEQKKATHTRNRSDIPTVEQQKKRPATKRVISRSKIRISSKPQTRQCSVEALEGTDAHPPSK